MHEKYTENNKSWNLVLTMRNAVKKSPEGIKDEYLVWSKLSIELLAKELEKSGWQYNGHSKNIRRLLLPHEKTDFKKLDIYNGDKISDIDIILKNTGVRKDSMIADFLSGAYVDLLEQELYKAGWNHQNK